MGIKITGKKIMSSDSVVAVILLAGLGSRLGRPKPKSLTPLSNGESIVERQVRILKSFDLPIVGVVGFKKDLIMEAVPEILFAYNPNYDTTNTSKSLLCAATNIKNKDILWINGDVVYDEDVIARVLKQERSSVVVNNASVAEEEIKYTLNGGSIDELSKQVENGLGEALGINLIRKEMVAEFCQYLEKVDDQDYFEKAMELMINQAGAKFYPLDVSDLKCIEVDFQEDLDKALELF